MIEVTGPRRLENDLVVPGTFTASTKSAAIGQKLKKQIRTLQEHGDGNNYGLKGAVSQFYHDFERFKNTQV